VKYFRLYFVLAITVIIITATLLSFNDLSMAVCNPFNLGVSPKQEITHDEYKQIQQRLISKREQIEKLVLEMYPTDRLGYTTQIDFMSRCTRGVCQILIDPEKGWFPEVKLEKIGSGGERCIVTSVPYLRIYPELARAKVKQLQEVGFNGYYLYFIGGYPNPTGAEIQYVGVPYAIKIFAMLEAQKRGFQKVIWVDSATKPLRDPAPLFERLEKTGAFIHGWPCPDDVWKYVMPQTLQLLKELTGTDVLKSTYVNSIVFGLKMDTRLAKKFIASYYKMLKLGTPFISCYPEEIVFSAIYGQGKYKKKWKPHHFPHLLVGEDQGPERIAKATREGAFFMHLLH
jgi:hypothetical protein